MAKQQKVNFVSVYKKLAKEKKAKKTQEVIQIACGGNTETIVLKPSETSDSVSNKEYIAKNEYKPLSSFNMNTTKKEKVFKRDVKKLHNVWNYVKTHNLILKAFSCYSIINGKKVENPHFPKYVKFLKIENKFWIINANYKFDITKVLPKSEVIGAHIYKDGNMQFTTKFHMYITCEPYYGKAKCDKVEKDAEK